MNDPITIGCSLVIMVCAMYIIATLREMFQLLRKEQQDEDSHRHE
jgi:hypothetical protein